VEQESDSFVGCVHVKVGDDDVMMAIMVVMICDGPPLTVILM